jgi:cell division protein ZapE
VSEVAERYRALVGAGGFGRIRIRSGRVAVLDRIAAQFGRSRGSRPGPPLRKGAAAAARRLFGGGVGRGKSMLMDLAFEAIRSSPSAGHFHDSCSKCTSASGPSGRRRKAIRSRRSPSDRGGGALLAFDEMVINNSADAMILSRLFAQLLEAGVTVITTSNRPPRDLYLGGLNRELFLPFIDLIEREMEVVPLNGPTDYRLERLGGFPTWHVPNGAEATQALSAAFFRLTDYPPEDRDNVPSEDIELGGGRVLHVPKSLKGVAVFSFSGCAASRAARPDYLAVARRYHSVIVVGIPRMGPENRNEAARFVTLIDALYEHKVKLLAAADAAPGELYRAGDGAFEFQRTVSRLIEMQSRDYLARGHGGEGEVVSSSPAFRGRGGTHPKDGG